MADKTKTDSLVLVSGQVYIRAKNYLSMVALFSIMTIICAECVCTGRPLLRIIWVGAAVVYFFWNKRIIKRGRDELIQRENQKAYDPER